MERRSGSWRISVASDYSVSFEAYHLFVLNTSTNTKEDCLLKSYAPGPGPSRFSGLFLPDLPIMADGDALIVEDLFQV